MCVKHQRYQLSPLGLKNPKLTFNFIPPINTDGEYAPGRSGDTDTQPLLSVCQNSALQLDQPLTKAHTFTKCDNITVTWNKSCSSRYSHVLLLDVFLQITLCCSLMVTLITRI